MAEAWEAQAWVLWRRRGLRPADVAAFLELEGWGVSAEEVESVVTARAGAELQRFFQRAGHPPGARGSTRAEGPRGSSD